MALRNLEHSGGLTIQDGAVLVKKSINKHSTFLSQMFEPFLLAYWVSVIAHFQAILEGFADGIACDRLDYV